MRALISGKRFLTLQNRICKSHDKIDSDLLLTDHTELP